MTILLRKFLLYLRQQNAKFGIKRGYQLFALSIMFVVVGIVCDLFFNPNNFWLNTIKLTISILIALSMFSSGYILYIIQVTYKSRETKYEDLRSKLSYQQRINISILISIICTILNFVFVKNGSILYTFMFAMLLLLYIVLLTFSRATHKEYVQATFGMRDIRDVDYEKNYTEFLKEQTKEDSNEEKQKEN